MVFRAARVWCSEQQRRRGHAPKCPSTKRTRTGSPAPLDLSSESRYATGSRVRVREAQSFHPRPRRLARPRTPAFHVGNTGSNPVGDALFTSEAGTPYPRFRVFAYAI